MHQLNVLVFKNERDGVQVAMDHHNDDLEEMKKARVESGDELLYQRVITDEDFEDADYKAMFQLLMSSEEFLFSIDAPARPTDILEAIFAKVLSSNV